MVSSVCWHHRTLIRTVHKQLSGPLYYIRRDMSKCKRGFCFRLFLYTYMKERCHSKCCIIYGTNEYKGTMARTRCQRRLTSLFCLAIGGETGPMKFHPFSSKTKTELKCVKCTYSIYFVLPEDLIKMKNTI